MAGPRKLLAARHERFPARMGKDMPPREIWTEEPGAEQDDARQTRAQPESVGRDAVPQAPAPKREMIPQLRGGHAIYTDLMRKHDRVRVRRTGS